MSVPTLMPQSVLNLVEAFTVGTHVVLRTAKGLDRAVEGVDEITTLMLQQQKDRLLDELQPVSLPPLDADVVELAAT